nr:MAG TPA: MYB PROTO-ONCOGENE PROTEIN, TRANSCRIPTION REGULATION, MYB, C-MYB.58A [Caudoviricetes sp.]
MCKPVKCPQCGHEFTPERAIKSGAWTPEEDELLLRLYQKERKLIVEIADELDRTQDATRNRLYQLRGGGKSKNSSVTASVQLSAKEFDEMRAARQEVKTARKLVEQAKGTERELAAFVAVGKQLLNARANKRVIAPVFAELEKLINAYSENF